MNLDSCDKVKLEDLKLINRRSNLQKGDILFNSIGANGDYYILKETPTEWNINESVFSIRVNEKILPEYLGYYFQTSKAINYYKSVQTGSTFKSIKISQLKKMKIPVPSLEQQKELIEKIQIIENTIELNENRIKKLNELNDSYYNMLFGDVLINSKKLNEKKWDEVLKIINGRNQKQVENKNGKYPIYGSGGIMSYADNYLCKENTIIVGRKGNMRIYLWLLGR